MVSFIEKHEKIITGPVKFVVTTETIFYFKIILIQTATIKHKYYLCFLCLIMIKTNFSWNSEQQFDHFLLS